MVLLSRLSEKLTTYLPLSSKSISKYLPTGLFVTGIIFVAWQLASITGFLLTETDSGQNDTLKSGQIKSDSKEKHQPIKAYDLFETKQSNVPKPSQPKKTDLNLLLHGTIAKSDPKQGSALISPKNAVPQVYRVGEQVSPGIVLDKIYPNYVILLQGNTYQKLALPKKHFDFQTNDKTAAKAVTQQTGEPIIIKEPRVIRKLTRYRKQLKENPMPLARLLKGSPVKHNGKIQGLQISRGDDPTLIQEMGLQDKDILMSLNGISLSDIKELPTLIKILSEEKQFEVELERTGLTQSVTIYLEM